MLSEQDEKLPPGFSLPRSGAFRGAGESCGTASSPATRLPVSAHQCDEFGVLSPLGLSLSWGKGGSSAPEVPVFGWVVRGVCRLRHLCLGNLGTAGDRLFQKDDQGLQKALGKGWPVLFGARGASKPPVEGRDATARPLALPP